MIADLQPLCICTFSYRLTVACVHWQSTGSPLATDHTQTGQSVLDATRTVDMVCGGDSAGTVCAPQAPRAMRSGHRPPPLTDRGQ